MKKLLFLFLLVGFYATSKAQFAGITQQVTLGDAKTNAIFKGSLTIYEALILPHSDTNYTPTYSGQIIIRPADSLAYISTGRTTGLKWVLLGSPGGGGSQWGVNITGDISRQDDLQSEFSTKQNVLPVGTNLQYWGADGSLQTFPSIPAQVTITSPNGSISVAGVYPNLTIQNSITRLGQLTNDVGFITTIPTITISGDASGSGTTSIPIVFPNIISPGSCTNCSVTFNAKGQPTAYTSGTGSNLIVSVFGRVGAVTAASGDYTAAQITNAVSTTGSYTNPTWIVSIPYTKITSTPTTIAGYGITDNIVNTFNTRVGAVTLGSSDVTTALTFTPVTNARTLTINGTTFDLTANRSWTVSGTGTLNRISPLDSLGSTANGLQISGQNLVPSSATATTAGFLTAQYWKTLDSIVQRTIINRIVFAHAGAGVWTGWTSPRGDSIYSKDLQNGVWTIIAAQTDSSLKLTVDSLTEHTYWNQYYLPKTATLTVNGTPYNLSSNPSITISGGGTSDTASPTTAGLMSTYIYNKTLHPLITWNDSTGLRDSIFHSNGDTLFAKAFVFGYGFKNWATQTTNYHIVDSSIVASVGLLGKIRDSLGLVKEGLISGTGYPMFSGASYVFQTAAQLTSSLSLVGVSTPGIVPAPGTNTGTHFFSDAGWTSLPAYSIFTANGVSSGSSTDSIYWGNAPLNQPTLITDPSANWLTFNGTYTTTANNQWYWSITPTVTLRATASDVTTGLSITPTFNGGANNQTMSALDINPVYTPGSFTGGIVYALRVGADIVPFANGVTNIGGGVNNFNVLNAHNLKSNGGIGIISSGTNNIVLTVGTTGTVATFGSTGIGLLGGIAASGGIEADGLSMGLSTDTVLTLSHGVFRKVLFSTLAGSVGNVISWNGRNGAVTAASGDYTAAQITNAVDATGSYSNPTWLTSLAYTKISAVAVNLTTQVVSTLPIANGGTGLSSAGSVGQILGVVSSNVLGYITSSPATSNSATPSVTGVSSNISSITNSFATYVRVGNTVTVTGTFNTTYTATGSTTVNIQIPVASNFTLTTDAIGSGSSNGSNPYAIAQVVASTSLSNQVIMSYIIGSTTTDRVNYTYQYTVK